MKDLHTRWLKPPQCSGGSLSVPCRDLWQWAHYRAFECFGAFLSRPAHCGRLWRLVRIWRIIPSARSR